MFSRLRWPRLQQAKEDYFEAVASTSRSFRIVLTSVGCPEEDFGCCELCWESSLKRATKRRGSRMTKGHLIIGWLGIG